MAHWLVAFIPRPVVDGLRAGRDALAWRAYRRSPVLPPPHVVKARTVIEHGRRFALATLVETGTFEGEMARKCVPHFRRIVTIELDPGLAGRAAHKLARFSNVEVIAGDSALRLPEVLASVSEPALFWLDGHFSGGGTARGAKDTPLLDELEAIRRHPASGHVILIDDARLLGSGDYPTFEELERRLKAIHPGGEVSVADDIVRCTPPGPRRADRPPTPGTRGAATPAGAA